MLPKRFGASKSGYFEQTTCRIKQSSLKAQPKSPSYEGPLLPIIGLFVGQAEISNSREIKEKVGYQLNTELSVRTIRRRLQKSRLRKCFAQKTRDVTIKI